MLKTAKCKGVTPHPSLLFTSLPHASRHSTNVPRFLSTATCNTVERPSSLKPCHVLPFDLPPFSLIGDFRKQNTRKRFQNFDRSCQRSIKIINEKKSFSSDFFLKESSQAYLFENVETSNMEKWQF